MTKTDFTPLQLTKTANGQTAVQCSQLYKALGLDQSNYTRWVQRNIIGDIFAIEGTDYLPLSIPLEEIKQTLRQKRKKAKSLDFILTLDFAKMLAMQTRSQKGHEIRLYFLQCEKQLIAVQTQLFTELEAYRELEAIQLQRRELNKQARKYREQIKQARNTIEYIQLTLNF